ncbi:MAG: hypothetical protein Q9O74_08880 [Planctomycetota bacterium]|nr:hypothetical protein [Planctomycetota bacterium]
MTTPMPENRSHGFVRKHWRLLSLCLIVLIAIGVTAVGVAWWAAARSGLLQGPKTAALGLGENWSEDAVEDARQYGQSIIAAIENYQAHNDGNLPPSLDRLVPEYMTALESPTIGDRQWRFGALRNHEDEYFLSVRSRRMNQPGYYGIEFLQYNSLDKQWTVFRSDP